MQTEQLAAACLVCQTALSGALGYVSKIAGIRRSDGNPNLCNRCSGHVQDGEIVELCVFFVDLSSYTALTQELGPDRMHELLDAFLRRTRDIIVKWDGYVTQFVGDEVMAFFNAPLQREKYASLAVSAALDIQGAIAELGGELQREINVTIGIAAGHARVGRVGSEEIAHYSAIGDVVNRAARLVSHVEAGGILVDEQIYNALADRFPDAETEMIALKGFSDPIAVTRLRGTLVDIAPETSGRRKRQLRLATTLAAILSAPCVGFIALNAAGIALGLGSFAMGAIALTLDQSIFRIPLLSFATLGACAILFTVLKREPATSDDSAFHQPTQEERRRNRLGLASAGAALLIVVAEIIAHEIMH